MEKLFWEALPQYLAIGMTAEEFWHGDLRLCKAYRDAYAITLENRYLAEWRAGAYVVEALRCAAPAYREFSKGEKHDYPSEPLFSNAQVKQAIEEEKAEARMKQQSAAFAAFAISFNKRFEHKEEKT